jgi:hypothetical protein
MTQGERGSLQESGIDGSGIGIAIIDQALLLDHEQYKDNLMLYEKIHCSDQQAQMHGPAVASIAVGKTVGVAPGAKLYYIADTYGHYTDINFDFDASIIADCILRVLDINKQLPENEKIRVISISRGYTTTDKGYEELTAAIDKANQENIFAITTSTEDYYHFSLLGMNRDYMKDPDDFNSFRPAAWIENDFYARPNSFKNDILVPMGSRAYAACTGTDKYEIDRDGGLSWAVPWFAGFYALCCQVKPDITPESFWNAALKTGEPRTVTRQGKEYKGKMINPVKLIEEVKNLK